MQRLYNYSPNSMEQFPPKTCGLSPTDNRFKITYQIIYFSIKLSSVMRYLGIWY